MTAPSPSRTDAYLRFSRRSLFGLLLMIVLLGGALLASAVWPDGAASRLLERSAYLVPIWIVVAVVVLQTAMRRQGLRPDSPEMKAVLDDEWRQASLLRACRLAFLVVLVAQAPLALVVAQIATPHPPVVMALATVTLGLAVFAGSFLAYDGD